MSHIFTALRLQAETRPLAIALQDSHTSLNYQQLLERTRQLALQLQQRAPRVIAILADNGIDWVVADLAALLAGIPIIPIPSYFTASQVQHVLTQAGVDLLLSQQALSDAMRLTNSRLAQALPHVDLYCYELAVSPIIESLPVGTAKITFTSGSTGQAKGVCLSLRHMEEVALSLRQATGASQEDRHLCVTPLATLLENIAGIYLPLMAGATCMVPTLAEVGLSGSSGLDINRQLACLTHLQASSAILVPQMLSAQIAAIQAGCPRPPALRYLAVGGGRVAPTLLTQARALGLPVYEGYGLSECASVVSLNTPDHDLPGSTGRPLPHTTVSIADDGEILVSGSHFLGYLGEAPSAKAHVLPSGDLGHIDPQVFLHISGRKKNLYISSFGRNISPEWIESEFLAQPGVLQIAVFGDGWPCNTAIVLPHPSMTAKAVEQVMAAANANLPDYARVRYWIRAPSPFSVANGQLTANGRVRRQAIHEAYSNDLKALF